MTHRNLCTWIFVFALVPLTACTKNRMYRQVSVEHTPHYSLAFVEFDDQGETVGFCASRQRSKSRSMELYGWRAWKAKGS